LSLGGTNRANLGAISTISTLLGIDHILIRAFADCLYRALFDADSAANAIITDNMRHLEPSLLTITHNIVTQVGRLDNY